MTNIQLLCVLQCERALDIARHHACNDILEVFLNTIDVWEVLRNTKYGGNVPATTSGVAKRQVYGNTKRFETPGVWTKIECFETCGVSKHSVFPNTKSGGRHVSTTFSVLKH